MYNLLKFDWLIYKKKFQSLKKLELKGSTKIQKDFLVK